MPWRPFPSRSCPAPQPSSRTLARSPSGPRSTSIHRLRARAWWMALATHSWMQRSRTWSRAGSAAAAAGGSRRWTAGLGIAWVRSRRLVARSPPSWRRWLTTLRISRSAPWARPWARSTASRAGGEPWPRCSRATSRLMERALTWWPRASWSSRARWSRSDSRLCWMSWARAATSSRTVLATSRRACRSRCSSSAMSTAEAWRPPETTALAHHRSRGMGLPGRLKGRGTISMPCARVWAPTHRSAGARLRSWATSQATKKRERLPKRVGHHRERNRTTAATKARRRRRCRRVLPPRRGLWPSARPTRPRAKATSQTHATQVQDPSVPRKWPEYLSAARPPITT
jgi:hypothetical protein